MSVRARSLRGRAALDSYTGKQIEMRQASCRKQELRAASYGRGLGRETGVLVPDDVGDCIGEVHDAWHIAYRVEQFPRIEHRKQLIYIAHFRITTFDSASVAIQLAGVN